MLRGGGDNDSAVTKHHNPVRHEHQERGGHQVDAGGRLDDLECGADCVRGRVGGTGHHSVSVAHFHHHGGEVGRICNDLSCVLDRHAFCRAKARQLFRVLLEVVGVRSGQDCGSVDVQSEGGGFGADLALVPNQDDVCNTLGKKLISCSEDSLILGFGKDDSLPVRRGALEEVTLKCQWGNNVRRRYKKGVDVICRKRCVEHGDYVFRDCNTSGARDNNASHGRVVPGCPSKEGSDFLVQQIRAHSRPVQCINNGQISTCRQIQVPPQQVERGRRNGPDTLHDYGALLCRA